MRPRLNSTLFKSIHRRKSQRCGSISVYMLLLVMYFLVLDHLSNDEQEQLETVTPGNLAISQDYPVPNGKRNTAIKVQSSNVHMNFNNSSFPLYARRLVLAIDLWERLVHTQSALRRLVNIAGEVDFSVVEPLVYEAKVSRTMAFEGDFAKRGLSVQTADMYYNTTELQGTGRYLKRIVLKRWEVEDAIVLTAGVIVEYGERHGWRGCVNSKRGKWGWRIGEGVWVQRILCVGDGNMDGEFWREGFQKIGGEGVLVFLNLRKSFLDRYEYKEHANKLHKVLLVSEWGRAEGNKVRQKLFGDRKIVGLQMRTGKMFSVLEKWKKKILNEGGKAEGYELFKRWFNQSVEALMAGAQREIDRRDEWGIYLASDMYHDGWKWGELCPEEVERVLAAGKKRLEEWGVKVGGWQGEDLMGRSGVVDAAVCLDADKFIYVTPSSMGEWIRWQRERLGKDTTVVGGGESIDEELKKIWAQRASYPKK